MLVLRGLPFLWLLPDRAGWAGDVLWVWREDGGTQISDTEDNAKFPQARSLHSVTGTWGITSNTEYNN